jgi:sugar phosphate isomerase/epimerase
MLTMKIAVALSCWQQPIKTALRLAADLGIQGVVIDARQGLRPDELSQTGARQFRKLLEDLNLQVSALAYPTRRGFGVGEDLDRRVEGTKAALQFARQLGTNIVLNQIGQVPADEQSREWQTMVEVLTDIANFSNKAGAILAAKTGSESAADLARLLDVLPAGLIGVDLDPGQLIVNGFSGIDAATTLGSRVRHVTVNDGMRDLAVGRGLEVQVGRGVADWPAMLGTLEEHGYRGWLSIDRRGSPQPELEVRETVEFLRSL